MIPIGDRNPRRTFPFITLALIILNVIVFIYELANWTEHNQLFAVYGVIPSTVLGQLNRLDVIPVASSFVSASFLHGSILHLGGNMLYLWVFGDNIEDHLGHLRFLIFYLACGTVALTAHIISSPLSMAPTIGASGAIAGVLGGYLILYPRAKISTIIPLIIFFPIVEIPAVMLLGFWLFVQIYSGILSPEAGNVAWWAHIGGFIAGSALIILFKIRTSFKR